MVNVPKPMTSFDILKCHRGAKEMDCGILRRVLIQQPRLGACRLSTFSGGKNCTMVSVARQVSFKA